MSVKSRTEANRPNWFGALKLDDLPNQCDLNGYYASYALLSSVQECRFLNTLSVPALRGLFASTYRKQPSSSCKCPECEFGEG
jgi:hypothetical protein